VADSARPVSLASLAGVARLHIVAIAALGTYTFAWLILGERPWLLALAAASDWFIVNLTNRVVDLHEDRVNAISGTSFVEKHRRALVALAFGSMAGTLVVGHVLVPEITSVRVAFHALGLAYNYPLLPGGRRIKQLYFFKNAASATGFLLTLFGFPVAVLIWEGHRPVLGISWSTVLVSALFFFAFELSYEVIYDLRDVPGDRAAGVATYPVVHGQAGAVRIIDALLAASIAILVIGFASGVLPWRIFVMIFAPVFQLIYYKRALRRGISSGDCILLTWIGAALLLAYNLWIEAGLPA
jgi:4-hydroxybenzoate polyprenyltransferase